uniref:Uncharacterized protein n=1 Tax=Anguilla anguilla TaxID=7936 RepID=A0A0E9STG3_ANGAN
MIDLQEQGLSPTTLGP